MFFCRPQQSCSCETSSERQIKMGKSALKTIAVPALIFLLAVLNQSVFVKAAKKDRCNCKSFSDVQKDQMKKILQSEAVNLRMGLKQMCGKRKPAEKWIKVTKKPVCFRARDDQFGRILVPFEGFVAAIKLVHKSGYVTGNASSSVHRSNWGCGARQHHDHHTHNGGGHGGHHGGHDSRHDHGPLNTYITSSRNSVLFPDDSIDKDPVGGWYGLPDVDANSPVLVLSQFKSPVYVSESQLLRLWYGEDLLDINEDNNGGRSCAHVFLWYI